MVPPPTHPESPSMGAATSTASSTLLFSKARTFFETYCLNLAVIGHLVLWVCGETPTLGFGATDSGRSDATTSSSSQEEAAEEDAARLLEQELVMAFEQQRAAEMEWFSDERRAEGFTAQAVVWARKAAEEAVKRQREEEQRRVEEAARVVREREEMQKRLRANARTRATRDGVHEGTFCDLAGNPNSVTLYKEKKDRWSSYAQRWRSCTPPTVREWRQVLAKQHFLAPSWRWVLIVRGQDVLMKENEELVFPLEPDEDGYSEIHAVMRYVPPLIKNLSEAHRVSCSGG